MTAHENAGLVQRKKADWIAGVVFAVALIASLTFLSGIAVEKLPRTTTTIVVTVQTVHSSRSTPRLTTTTAKTTSDVIPSFWQSLLGSRTPFIFLIAISLLIAFLLAAVTQRVLLGQYGFSFGPLTVNEITGVEVKDLADSTLAGVLPKAEASPDQAKPEPIWTMVADPNLALAGWRIDAEKELKRIGEEFHIPPADSRTLGRLLTSLSRNGVIGPDAASGLRDLLDLANRGVHGAAVDQSVIEVLRTEGGLFRRGC